MTISIKRYVEITSGVAADAGVAQRELIGRLFTPNPLAPIDSILEFESADEVGDYFGTTSEEYDRAVFYFGYISKNITAPQKLSFVRWAESAVAATIYGDPGSYLLATFTAISNGDFTMTLGASTFHMTAIDFSAAVSLAGVASVLQTKIRAQSGGGAAWTSATVTYDATRASFNFVAGATGANVISLEAGSTVDVLAPLGWATGSGVILSDGSAAQTVSDILADSTEASDNFGSFTFIDSNFTQDQIVEAAEWNDTQNNMFMFCPRVTAATAAAVSAAVFTLSGVGLTLAPLSDEYPEMAPMMQLAATDYTRRNSTINYMFKDFDLSPSVTTNADANTYDDLRVNYYGQTQSAGQNLSFYQRGYLMGGSTDAKDMNTYANEQWLKSASTASLMSLLLAQAKVSANRQGQSQILAVLQSVIDLALLNGTISVGKILNVQQKLFISNTTGDPEAWRQVQNIGYWVGVTFQEVVVDSSTQYKAIYTLIYAKDDVIRKIEGTHALI